MLNFTETLKSNLKGCAIGLDDIHSEFLTSIALKSFFCLFLRTEFVPELWKCPLTSCVTNGPNNEQQTLFGIWKLTTSSLEPKQVFSVM